METQSIARPAKESLRVLLAGLIDYAGLFPPAALSMERDVENFARYLHGEYSWILNCCVVPVARLAEFEAALAKARGADRAAKTWKLSVLVGANLEAELRQIVAFNERHAAAANGPCVVEALEIKAASAKAVRGAMAVIPRSLQSYFEVPLTDALAECLSTVRETGACAKVRTGGVTADVFPLPEQVAGFLEACARARVKFKATAGLHHPIRAVQRLTYEPNSASGTMFGFLNVFLAAAYAFHGMGRQDIAQLLDERSAAEIRFDDAGVSWRGHGLTNQQIARARASFCTSFGSCSFEEPIADLRTLGLL